MKIKNFIFNGVGELPEEQNMQDGIVYIASGYGVVGLKCPCGCGDIVYLRINSTQHPCWGISGNSITPSIQKNTGCRSHFTITNGIAINNG